MSINEGSIHQSSLELLKSCSFDVVSQIFSFCDVLDLYHLLSAKKDFEKSVTSFLAAQQSISASCLVRTFKNTIPIDNEAQQYVVSWLISLLLKAKTNHLASIEFSGLRNLSGLKWLPQLKSNCQCLQKLDLSGCNFIDPVPLVAFLTSTRSYPRPSLRFLRLTGCVRVGNEAIQAIGQYHQELESLSLGNCSQAITTNELNEMLPKLTKLKDLDLQLMKRLKDQLILPATLKSINLSACEGFRMKLESCPMLIRYWQDGRPWKEAPVSVHKMRHLVLDDIGTPRRGLHAGTLTYFALGRQLCEVHLSGCEQVKDWEVQALAEVCGHSLNVFQMRACQIGNAALVALGTHCTCLSECDVSACFLISDEGVTALCNNNRILVHDRSNPKRQRHRSTLKSLKIASLPLLTDTALASVSYLDYLLVLDIHDCAQITASALVEAVGNMRRLIDVNSTGIKKDPISFGRRLRKYPAKIPLGLRYVDQRSFETDPAQQHNVSCCTVRKYSQRLKETVPKQYMYHCVDCGLVPQVNRGLCSSCVSKCHKNHQTYLGSWSRFYCDCSFSGNTAGEWPSCQVLFLPPPLPAS